MRPQRKDWYYRTGAPPAVFTATWANAFIPHIRLDFELFYWRGMKTNLVGVLIVEQ